MRVAREALRLAAAPLKRFGAPRTGAPGAARRLLAVGCALALVRAVAIAPVRVEGASMLPNLQSRQLLLVDKLAYGLCWSGHCALRWGKPRLGDVVVTSHPHGEGSDWIKRVVALPGDRVEMRRGQLWHNGRRVATRPGPEVDAWDSSTAVLPLQKLRVQSEWECLSTSPHLVFSDPGQNFGAVSVPDEHVWVLGDHRGDSRDSRVFGPVPVRAVRGRVSAWSLRFWARL